MNRHFQKKTFMQPANIWKKAHHHWSLEKCNTKPHWDAISHKLKWWSLKKSGDNRSWRGCGEIRVLLHCWWECKLVQPLWKTVWWFLKDLEIEMPFDSAILLLGIYPEDYKSFYYKDTCTCTHVYCDTVHNNKDLEPTQMPINDGLDKENVVHIHHAILCSHKMYEFMSFAGAWMKLEIIILSKQTQEQKAKHCMFSLISGC